MVSRLRQWIGNRSDDAQLVATLQEVLRFNLRCAVHYPRMAELVKQTNPDPELQGLLLEWGSEQLKCAEEVGFLITKLGSEPLWISDCRADEFESHDFFALEVIRQSKALARLQDAVVLAAGTSIQQRISDLASGEEQRLQELVVIQKRIYGSKD